MRVKIHRVHGNFFTVRLWPPRRLASIRDLLISKILPYAQSKNPNNFGYWFQRRLYHMLYLIMSGCAA